MTTADRYRQYAAECVKLSQGRSSADEKAKLMEMAAMWLRLAEFADKRQGGEPLA